MVIGVPGSMQGALREQDRWGNGVTEGSLSSWERLTCPSSWSLQCQIKPERIKKTSAPLPSQEDMGQGCPDDLEEDGLGHFWYGSNQPRLMARVSPGPRGTRAAGRCGAEEPGASAPVSEHLASLCLSSLSGNHG